MGAADYFRSAVSNLHRNLTEAVEGLSDKQLHFRPLGKGNHIAFIIWHYVRTEDTVLNFFLQKKTPVWNAEGWDEKLGMDSRVQGTGMTDEQAAGIQIRNLKEFLHYMHNTFKASEAFIDDLKDEDLDQEHELPVLGKKSLYQIVGDTILQHGGNHLGEIWYLRGIQNLKGSPA